MCIDSVREFPRLTKTHARAVCMRALVILPARREWRASGLPSGPGIGAGTPVPPALPGDMK